MNKVTQRLLMLKKQNNTTTEREREREITALLLLIQANFEKKTCTYTTYNSQFTNLYMCQQRVKKRKRQRQK
jgi:glucosamine 6-phosphate synthetase-like amidotransferase/phosphosugar isomerase protein